MQHNWRQFARHYVEMVLAMTVGMLVLGSATHGVLALADVRFSTGSNPELALLEMAFDMSVGMTVWMRHRGHAWPAVLEMCAAMFVPALVLVPLLWLGAVPSGSLLTLEHLVMLPLMFLVMLRRQATRQATRPEIRQEIRHGR